MNIKIGSSIDSNIQDVILIIKLMWDSQPREIANNIRAARLGKQQHWWFWECEYIAKFDILLSNRVNFS